MSEVQKIFEHYAPRLDFMYLAHILIWFFYHILDLVVKQIKGTSEGATELQLGELGTQLKTLVPKVKDLALSARKTNASQAHED